MAEKRKGNISKKRVDMEVAESIKASIKDAKEVTANVHLAVEKYPKIIDGYWHVWDWEKGDVVNSGVPATGPNGEQGEKGEPGPQGEKGEVGEAGQNGKDGYTPQRGTDYWTDEDKEEIVSQVKEELGDMQIDGAMSASSENAVQNKVIKKYVDDKFNIEYSDESPPVFGKTPIGKLWINKTTHTMYRCVNCYTIEHGGTYMTDWEILLCDTVPEPGPLIVECLLYDDYNTAELYVSIEYIENAIINGRDIILDIIFMDGEEVENKKTKAITFGIEEDIPYLRAIIDGVGYEFRYIPDSECEWNVSVWSDKTDKITISTSTDTAHAFEFSNTHNTEKRLAEAISISFTFGDGEYAEDYTAGLSFDSGETATSIDYTDSGILNWVGTDCTNADGLSIFQPSANTHYDIVFYFNGVQFIGLVNGFVPATGNVVSE